MSPRRKTKPTPTLVKNRLYFGDCRTVMNEYMKLGSADLIYLDPPFSSNRDYNNIYKDETGRPLPDQIEAFTDIWELTPEREEAIKHMPVLMREEKIDDDVVEFWRLWMKALRETHPKLLAYLSYMVERLLFMKKMLKPTGSIYLHCDPTASHYIKVMMDAIFGHQNFRNQIVWKRHTSMAKGSQHDPKSWGATTDMILYYARSAAPPQPYRDMTEEERVEQFPLVDEHGERYYDDTAHLWRSPNMGERPNLCYEWKGFHHKSKAGWRLSKKRLEEEYQKGNVVILDNGKLQRRKYERDYRGKQPGDLWDDVSPALGSERLSYDTQKPLALLERIIEASSRKGDVVFDPFCGCGTTLEAAHTLGRRWIGIDISIHAIKRVARTRLEERCGLIQDRDFVVEGVPHTLEGAKDLWEQDKYQFQKWAVGQVDGFVTRRRSGDGGIDGRLYFVVTHERELQSMVIEVKGGKHVSLEHVRALRGVLEREEAAMAGLIVMEEPGLTQLRNFRREFSKAGSLDILGKSYPKMQMLTVSEILKGKRFLTPTVSGRKVAQPTLFG